MLTQSRASNKYYLAGPMTGMPDDNFPAFTEAAARLREMGYVIYSPAEDGRVKDWDWNAYMRRGLTTLLTCQGIIMLPNSKSSRGACLEKRIAIELDIPVFYYEDY